MEQELEVRIIMMLRKLSLVPKSLEVHFRCHGMEGSRMVSNLSLTGDLGPQSRHTV